MENDELDGTSGQWKRRRRKGTTTDDVTSVDTGDTAKNCECFDGGQWRHMVRSCPEKGKRMHGKEKARETTKERENEGKGL